MEECYKCGISGERARLFDVISSEGLVKMCEKCADEEGLPIVKKPTTYQLKEAERKRTTYERLAKASGMDVNKEKKDFSKKVSQKDVSLRDLADKNFNKGLGKGYKPRKDLIENFHWKIMRARRFKHLSKAKLAERIGESEAAIDMAEKGVLPEDDYRIINKLESFLGIKIIKKEYKEIAKKQKDSDLKNLDFSSSDTQNVRLADLRKAKKKIGQKEPYWKKRINRILEKEKKGEKPLEDSEALSKKPLENDLKNEDFKKRTFNTKKDNGSVQDSSKIQEKKEAQENYDDLEGEKISSEKMSDLDKSKNKAPNEDQELEKKDNQGQTQKNKKNQEEEKKNKDSLEKERLTQEDMDDIIFGGK